MMSLLVKIFILVVIGVLVSSLGILAWGSIYYKGKLYAKVLMSSGDVVKKEISDKTGSFTVSNGDTSKSYSIESSKKYVDGDLFPRRTLFYVENKTKPISSSDFKNSNSSECPLYISPKELNDILRVKFKNLFATESEGIFSGFSISKKWVVVLAVLVALGVVSFLYGGEILELIGVSESVSSPETPENVITGGR